MKIEEQQEKAIKSFRTFIEHRQKEQDALYNDEEFYKDDIEQNELVLKMLYSVLKTIEQQQSELKKKDKIINLMANFIDDVDKDDKICSIIGEEVCNTFENGILNCIECIKQYFERRAEE